MLVYQRGQAIGWKSVGAVLRERWDEQSKARDVEIAKRAKGIDVPPSDEPPCETCGKVEELEPFGLYTGDPGLDSLQINFQSLSLARYEGFSGDWAKSLVESNSARLVVCREFAKATIRGLKGLTLANGTAVGVDSHDEPDDAILDILEDNDLLDGIFIAGAHLQSLSGEQRKNCGVSLPSTSQPSIASAVAATLEPPEGATEEPSPKAGGLPERTKSTKQTAALNASS